MKEVSALRIFLFLILTFHVSTWVHSSSSCFWAIDTLNFFQYFQLYLVLFNYIRKIISHYFTFKSQLLFMSWTVFIVFPLCIFYIRFVLHLPLCDLLYSFVYYIITCSNVIENILNIILKTCVLNNISNIHKDRIVWWTQCPHYTAPLWWTFYMTVFPLPFARITVSFHLNVSFNSSMLFRLTWNHILLI